jgi:RNA polymerase sigma factor (sigma-70 family)
VEKRRHNRLIDGIQQLVSTAEPRTETDQKLLQRFVSQHDEAAFAAVVRRHGPMVLRVALRTLQNEHDAEDVFQATFLVLSQRAHTLRRPKSLGSWLYGVAYRLALKTKATAAQRRNRERGVAARSVAAPLAQLTLEEAQTILDEELSRLPERCRQPVVLCCLEGLARDEAAQQIGCPTSVLKSRLEQARERLRQRLMGRGLTLPCGLGAFLLLEGAAAAALPPALIDSTTKAATLVAAGKTAAEGLISAKVAALTEGVLKAMLISKVQAIVAVVVVLGFFATGATVLTYRTVAAQSTTPAPPIAKEPEKTPQGPEEEKGKEAFTAWGKEVGGLQAGLGHDPGQKRAYGLGETVRLVLRVRNVRKEAVKFEFHRTFFMEYPPAVTDGQGKRVRLTRVALSREIAPEQVNLAPGKEIELYELKFKLQPASEKKADDGDVDFGGRVSTLYGTGKFQIRYERFIGESSADPTLSKLATGKLELEIKPAPPAAPEKKAPQKQEQKREKEGLTAWGKEIGGLQAGLGFRPGEKRAYSHDETVKLVVRVRNVGKEEVTFEYLSQFFVENPPAVTDGQGKPVRLPRVSAEGEHIAKEVNLSPEKEIGLYELNLKLRPAGKRGDDELTSLEDRLSTLYGTGKFQIQYERVLGGSSSGTIMLDPRLSKLATGKLELEIKSDPPPVSGNRPKDDAELDRKQATELGMEVRAEPAGPDAVCVELEFETKGALKNYSHTQVEISDVRKLQISSPVREDRSKPGRVVVSFTADRANLEKITLIVATGAPTSRTGYKLRVKDFVEVERIRRDASPKEKAHELEWARKSRATPHPY